MARRKRLHRVAALIDELSGVGYAPADRAQEACRVVLHVDVPLVDDNDETDATERLAELIELLGFDCEIGGESE